MTAQSGPLPGIEIRAGDARLLSYEPGWVLLGALALVILEGIICMKTRRRVWRAIPQWISVIVGLWIGFAAWLTQLVYLPDHSFLIMACIAAWGLCCALRIGTKGSGRKRK